MKQKKITSAKIKIFDTIKKIFSNYINHEKTKKKYKKRKCQIEIQK